jgi:hypothetical protein
VKLIQPVNLQLCTYTFTIGSILVRHAHAFYSSVQILQQLLSLLSKLEFNFTLLTYGKNQLQRNPSIYIHTRISAPL